MQFYKPLDFSALKIVVYIDKKKNYNSNIKENVLKVHQGRL